MSFRWFSSKFLFIFWGRTYKGCCILIRLAYKAGYLSCLHCFLILVLSLAQKYEYVWPRNRPLLLMLITVYNFWTSYNLLLPVNCIRLGFYTAVVWVSLSRHLKCIIPFLCLNAVHCLSSLSFFPSCDVVPPLHPFPCFPSALTSSSLPLPSVWQSSMLQPVKSCNVQILALQIFIHCILNWLSRLQHVHLWTSWYPPAENSTKLILQIYCL